jgi:hypothetical protein
MAIQVLYVLSPLPLALNSLKALPLPKIPVKLNQDDFDVPLLNLLQPLNHPKPILLVLQSKCGTAMSKMSDT